MDLKVAAGLKTPPPNFSGEQFMPAERKITLPEHAEIKRALRGGLEFRAAELERYKKQYGSEPWHRDNIKRQLVEKVQLAHSLKTGEVTRAAVSLLDSQHSPHSLSNLNLPPRVKTETEIAILQHRLRTNEMGTGNLGRFGSATGPKGNAAGLRELLQRKLRQISKS